MKSPCYTEWGSSVTSHVTNLASDGRRDKWVIWHLEEPNLHQGLSITNGFWISTGIVPHQNESTNQWIHPTFSTQRCSWYGIDGRASKSMSANEVLNPKKNY